MTLIAIFGSLLLTYIFIWALWRAEHLDQNVMFLRWLRCKFRRKGHRPARHPLGGYRCLDCFLAGTLEDMGLDDDEAVKSDRRIYTERRGA